MQSQYDGDLENVPVGLVDFGLPRHLSQDYWDSEEHWNSFRDGLLNHLMRGLPKIKAKLVHERDRPSKKSSKLDFYTIDSAAQEFERFRLGLISPDENLPILPVCCPERKVR